MSLLSCISSLSFGPCDQWLFGVPAVLVNGIGYARVALPTIVLWLPEYLYLIGQDVLSEYVKKVFHEKTYTVPKSSVIQEQGMPENSKLFRQSIRVF